MQRNKRSLDAMLKTIAPYVCPRQIMEWSTAGQWRAYPYIVPQTTAKEAI